MPDASQSDVAAVIALEVKTAADSEPSAREDTDREQCSSDVSSRLARACGTLLLGGIAVTLFIAVTAFVIAEARTETRQEASPAAVRSISLRQLLTRFSSTLPSEWQGAPIVAARDRVHRAISLPVSTSATTKRDFLVIRCPSKDGQWSVRVHSRRRPSEELAIGRCGDIEFAPLPLDTDTVRVEVRGSQAYAIVVMAHS